MDNIRLRIGQLAGLVGVSTKTIRHYHKIGLLPPAERSPNNYRQYNFADLYRLKIILRLKGVGFSLAEIRSILHSNDADTVLRQRLSDLEQQLADQIAQLQKKLQRVQALIAEKATLRDVDRPDIKSSLTYRMLIDVLQGYGTGSSSDAIALDQSLLSRLDTFNWGEEYRAYWEQIVHALADNVGSLHAVGERIVAVAHMSAHDPQLEVIADEVAKELQKIHTVFALPDLEQPLQAVFKQVVVHAVQETLTPAQEHLIGLIRRRLYE